MSGRTLALLALVLADLHFCAASGGAAFTVASHSQSGQGGLKRVSLRRNPPHTPLSLVKADIAVREDAEPTILPTGARLSPQVTMSPEGRIIAVEPIKQRGTCLLAAPMSNAIIEEIGAGGLIEARQRLACRLLSMEVENLKHLGLEMLPRKVDLPHSWTDEELSELQWAPLEAAAKAEKSFLEEAWKRMQGVEVPLGRFLEVESIVRKHARQPQGDPRKLVLLPESVLLQRTAPRGGSLLIQEEAGEVQVVSGGGGGDTWGASISSGWVTNDELLLNEGWADQFLESDAVCMEMDFLWGQAEGALSLAPELRAKQNEVLQSLERYQYLKLSSADGGKGGGKKGASLSILHGGYASDELGMVLQVLALTGEELDAYGVAGCAMNIGETVPLSVDHEQRVGRLLMCASESLLSSFPTDISTDEALLEQPDISDRLRQCLHSRLSKKRCLKSCMNIAQAFVNNPTATGTLRRPWKANIKTSG